MTKRDRSPGLPGCDSGAAPLVAPPVARLLGGGARPRTQHGALSVSVLPAAQAGQPPLRFPQGVSLIHWPSEEVSPALSLSQYG